MHTHRSHIKIAGIWGDKDDRASKELYSGGSGKVSQPMAYSVLHNRWEIGNLPRVFVVVYTPQIVTICDIRDLSHIFIMAPCLSNELRERIIVWYYYQEWSFEDIIELSGCSKNTIYRVLSNFEKFGQATNPHCRPAGRKRTLLSTDLMYIQGLLSALLWTTWCR